MVKLNIAGQQREIAEPCFKNLRKIIVAYNQLSVVNLSTAEKFTALESILSTVTDNTAALKKLKTGELEALLQAIPEICHLKPSLNQKSKIETDWGSLYAHLSVCMGWTYDYIDNYMTLSRLEEYQPYFQKHPPTHQLAAAYLGYEYRNKQNAKNFLASIAAQVKANQARHSS